VPRVGREQAKNPDGILELLRRRGDLSRLRLERIDERLHCVRVTGVAVYMKASLPNLRKKHIGRGVLAADLYDAAILVADTEVRARSTAFIGENLHKVVARKNDVPDRVNGRRPAVEVEASLLVGICELLAPARSRICNRIRRSASREHEDRTRHRSASIGHIDDLAVERAAPTETAAEHDRGRHRNLQSISRQASPRRARAKVTFRQCAKHHHLPACGHRPLREDRTAIFQSEIDLAVARDWFIAPGGRRRAATRRPP
jgi:hypothetical protein